METDWSSLHRILSDTTRRNILQLLSEKETLSYTEIMTLLQITNTGRLNYHLKSLGNLISKDDAGKYHLTEQGRLAASLVKTFPERITPEKRLSVLKIAVAVVLVMVGILVIVAFAFAALGLTFATASTSGSVGTSSQVIPQNTTIYLLSWSASGNPLSVSWSATSPVHIYVLNQTQYGNLVLQHSTGTQTVLENFTGAPGSWVSQYYLQSGNVSLNLQPSLYYFFAGSQAQTFLSGFKISQLLSQQQPAGISPSNSFFLFLVLSVFIVIGAVLVILGVSILTRRVWR